jgi:hypothetical protein
MSFLSGFWRTKEEKEQKRLSGETADISAEKRAEMISVL